ncbi:MAG: copper-binding protein [Pseudomonadota bacterium]
MKDIRFSALAATLLTVGILGLSPAMGQDKMKMNHGAMKMKAPADVTEAEAKGKINSVDADSGKVNVTHEPVEALGWPTMTMDLPVTRRVDLSAVKPGADVTFKLKKGRDDQFRITEITPAK